MSEPKRFVAFHIRAPAKINLRLQIVGRRADGYHLLDSDVLPVSLFDDIRVRVSAAKSPKTIFVSNVPELTAETDLTVRAAELFMRRTGKPMRVAIRLVKRIPMGAGLGGGSSDAAAILRCLAASIGRSIPPRTLRRWAVELGADVPFFVAGRPARVSGIGEVIRPISRVPAWPLVIAFPGVGLPTSAVYRVYDRSLTNRRVESTIRASALERLPLAEILINDLEAAATRILPELRSLKRRLEELGAAGTMMTGSGSAIFGVWNSKTGARTAARQLKREGIWARAAEILARSPAIRRCDLER